MGYDMITMLSQTAIFRDLPPGQLQQVCRCLSPDLRSFGKREVILKKNAYPLMEGIVLSGRVNLEYCDYRGNRNILEILREQELLGLTGPDVLGEYIAGTDVQVMILNLSQMLNSCEKSCVLCGKVQQRILQGYFSVINRQRCKLECISQRSTRQKIIAFFLHCAREAGTSAFELDLTRQELADFLCVNRSALIEELRIMKSNGDLFFYKNYFELKRSYLP